MCTPANLTIRNSVKNAFCTVIRHMDKVYKSKIKIVEKVIDKLQTFDRRTKLTKTVENA